MTGAANIEMMTRGAVNIETMTRDTVNVGRKMTTDDAAKSESHASVTLFVCL